MIVNWVALLFIIFLPGLAMKLFTFLLRRTTEDPAIEQLLSNNKAQFLPGMAEPDWNRIRIIGRQRWEDIRKAQERLTK